MFYTIEDNFVDKFLKDIYTTKTSDRLNSQFEATILEDGKQQVTVNTTGHNPKDMIVDVTDEQITIKSTKGEKTSSFVKEIDLVLTVGTDYDGTKTTANFDNGLLTLLIDKKSNKKAKKVKKFRTAILS
jgi:HSP20 family molecular chaperone IbpA